MLDPPTDDLHQLGARPPVSSFGCIQRELETPSGLHIPPIQFNCASSQQGRFGQDRNCPSGPTMASSALVATTTQSAGAATNSSTNLNETSDKPDRSSTDSPVDPTTSSGRVSYLQQRYSNGISRNVAELLIPVTRRSTQKTYDSSWKRWCSLCVSNLASQGFLLPHGARAQVKDPGLRGWCVSGQIDPISASLSNILSFLADCFDDGLQYRSINVLRSALSSTHPKIDGYAVGQHPYVLNLMKGILNNRPPKPRYSYTWDVRQVTEHMKQMGSDSSLSLKQLSLKLATVLALTCPKRVLSLAKLDINHHRLSPEGAIFTLTTPTKTSRPDETVTAFFSSFARCCFVSGGLP